MFKAQRSADISWLFETNALEISPAQKPFWYTSGLIGPYFINTHFLCGGRERAREVLELIDQLQNDRSEFPSSILEMLRGVYDSHDIYHSTLDGMLDLSREAFPLEEVDYISGGQRRDWFFAPLFAEQLDKPCLYIYNDQSIIDSSGKEVHALSGARVLNVADLLTVGSSYTKKWIPAIESRGGTLCWSLNGVDRRQGGEENLVQGGVNKVVSLFAIDLSLFDAALERGLINSSQYDLVRGYLDDPFASMQEFLRNNPQFLEDAKTAQDEKTRTRLKLLIEQDLYQLGK